MSTTVLLADAEPATRALERQLAGDGFRVVATPEARPPDLVLAGHGYERFCGDAPVIVLGPPDAGAGERVRAFRCGCDDYLARPFDYEELVERIRAVLRRSRPAPPRRVVAGPVELDLRARVAAVHGVPVRLAQKEYALLARLAAEPDRVFTRQELLHDVWGYNPTVRTRTLDSHACRLRRKLREAGGDDGLVENVWGVGYRLLGSLPERGGG